MIDRESKTPLYEQIYNCLKDDIQAGKYQDLELLPSERELCAMFGVERITVRKALENLAGDGLVVKVPGLGTRVNSKANTASISDADKSPGDTILFILPSNKGSVEKITDTFNARLFYCVERAARLKNYNTLYRTVGSQDTLEGLLSPNVAGIIFISKIENKLLLDTAKANIPAVMINSISDGFTNILCEDINGALAAVNYLIEQGHQKIAAIQGIPDYVTARNRLEGYKKALASAGIPFRPELVKEGNWTYEGGYTAMKDLLQNVDNLPTAVFTFNDVTAFGAIAAISDCGFTVPNDISVIGFDDIRECEYMRPRLSTVAVDINLMAKVAVTNLLTEIEEKRNFDLTISIPTKLMVRDSVSQNS